MKRTETERWIEQWPALATGRMIVWQTKWKSAKVFFFFFSELRSSLVFCACTYQQHPGSPFGFSLDPYLFGTCTWAKERTMGYYIAHTALVMRAGSFLYCLLTSLCPTPWYLWCALSKSCARSWQCRSFGSWLSHGSVWWESFAYRRAATQPVCVYVCGKSDSNCGRVNNN